MDSNFTIRPRAGIGRGFGPRDPLPVREVAETELDGAKVVAAPGDGQGSHERRHRRHDENAADHAADVVVTPDASAVIYRERDVRASPQPAPSDQVLRSRKAYGQPAAGGETSSGLESHADIEA